MTNRSNSALGAAATVSAPVYFETIRQHAARRWSQLEADAELAAPWHQLFKQVQSPRHILSELLQNADDAGATEASVCVEDGVFLFAHNGEDFKEEHFASLCRFGYSNKRALHTIGFRGIGFKSTFSLGDCVELFTPTLSVAFNRRRFTEPSWIERNNESDGRTHVRVAIRDPRLQAEVERNLSDWRESPVSLLFFKHLRRLRIGTYDLKWDAIGPGPVIDSVRMALNGDSSTAYILLSSGQEAFPAEALAEIRQERMLESEEDGAFPPCRVQIVLGATGRLYVVLPTGVETELPFACNAPFVQDPARLKIKDPETSPTNRWLLERCGHLAASAMLEWLRNENASEDERAKAYAILPDVDLDASSLEDVCAAIAQESFAGAVAGCNLLLSETGELCKEQECVMMARQIHDVWASSSVTSRFDKLGRPLLSVHVAAGDRRKLRNWGMVDEIDKAMILAVLKEQRFPTPSSWSQLLMLWAYVAPDITGYRYFPAADKLNIVPVSHGDSLLSASEVVRLDERRLLHSQSDSEFMRNLVTVVHEDWIAYLGLRHAALKSDPKSPGAEAVAAANAVLEKLGLALPSDLSRVFANVAAEFFSSDSCDPDNCVRLAQIAAKLAEDVSSSFWFVTCDGFLRSCEDALYFDVDGSLSALMPESVQESHILCPEYGESFESCSREDWLAWLKSGCSGLYTAPKLRAVETAFTASSGFLALLRTVSPGAPKPLFPYTSSRLYSYQRYTLRDFDFEEEFVARWNSMPSEENVWGQVIELLANSPPKAWGGSIHMQAEQTSTNGQSSARVDIGTVPAAWVRRFRAKPCLPDTHGHYRRPDELLRRNSETEALMGVEAFLHHRLDRPEIYPLLDVLGVRSSATGPQRLLDALRALAKTPTPPVTEVDKWYRRLDQYIESCSTSDSQEIQSALRYEKLVLSHEGEWTTANAIYESAGEEALPDLALIRPTVVDLSLWRRVGVAERPTADLAIAWLATLKVGDAPAGADLRRVRSLLLRYPIRIWSECGLWLNLQGEWVPTNTLKYALTMQSLVPWSHLFPSVKEQTADLQRLPGDVTRDKTFAHLPLLAECIDERMENHSLFEESHEPKEWLRTVGIELLRIELDSAEETERIRNLAVRLATTKWIESRGLQIVPYIEGTPAGTSRSADVVWIDRQLLVEPQPGAKLAKRVPEEVAKPFGRQDIRSALDYCFERSVNDVREYLRENFALAMIDQRDVPVSTNAYLARDAESDGAKFEPAAPVAAVEATDSAAECDGTGKPETTLSAETTADEHDNQTGAWPSADHDERRTSTSRVTPPSERPGLIERFAALRGFRMNGRGGFTHANGERLVRATGSLFSWEQYASDGELIRAYYAREHCLDRAPLELETEAWGLLEKFPVVYSMLLLNIDSAPVEMTGVQLRGMRDAGLITLYPAAYRLVLEQSTDA